MAYGACHLTISIFIVLKQKTAYEMRISDWSSDVCSSDLWRPCPQGIPGTRRQRLVAPYAVVFARTSPRIQARAVEAHIGRQLPAQSPDFLSRRSEARLVGQECVSTSGSRWSPHHS